MDLPADTTIVAVASNSISIAACLIFFCFYLKGSNQSLGLRMILVLCSSDFLFHISDLLICVSDSPQVLDVGLHILIWALRFSVFWTCNIAYLLYNLFKMDELANLSKYFKVSVFVLIFFNIVLTLVGQLLQDTLVLDFMVTGVGPAIISVLLSVYFYFRTAQILKKSPFFLSGFMNITPTMLYLYAALQLVLVIPSTIYLVMMIFLYENSLGFQIAISLILGLAGFLNSMVYFFCRKKSINLTFNREKSSEIDHSAEDISHDTMHKGLVAELGC